MFLHHARRAGLALLVAPSLVLAAEADAPFTIRGAASFGTAWRTAERDPNLIQRTNGAAAGVPANAPHGRNQDDGNLNSFDKGDAIPRVLKGHGAADFRRDATSHRDLL